MVLIYTLGSPGKGESRESFPPFVMLATKVKVVSMSANFFFFFIPKDGVRDKGASALEGVPRLIRFPICRS